MTLKQKYELLLKESVRFAKTVDSEMGFLFPDHPVSEATRRIDQTIKRVMGVKKETYYWL